MTEQEALFQLGQFDFEYVMTEAQREAYRMAIKALEKQMPKEPIYSNKYGNRDSCQRCNEIINYRIDNYCHRCGQRIDWGE